MGEFEFDIYYCKKCQAYTTVRKDEIPTKCYYCGNSKIEKIVLEQRKINLDK